jgi:ADP-heptose:LPS heptosyltransferase
MRLPEHIQGHINKIQTILTAIDVAMAEEMSKVFTHRSHGYIRFLHFEKKAYSLALSELEAISRSLTGDEIAGESLAPAREWVIDSIKTQSSVTDRELAADQTHRIVTWGGIGDILLTTPAIRSLKRRYPSCRIHVYCALEPHKEALMNNPYIDRLIFVGIWGRKIINLLRRTGLAAFHITNYGNLGPNYYRKSAAEIIGEKLGIEVDDSRPDCFLTEEEEREARRITSEYPNPVAIQIASKSSNNKSWLIENWERLIVNNPRYNFLQLGLADEELIRGAVDLRGKTTLRQAFGVVKTVRAFIGPDSALAHAATAFRTPAVVLFGASTPMVWGHTTNKNLYCPPHCSPCMDTLAKKPCPYGKLCMSNITVSDVERALSLSIGEAAERVT